MFCSNKSKYSGKRRCHDLSFEPLFPQLNHRWLVLHVKTLKNPQIHAAHRSTTHGPRCQLPLCFIVANPRWVISDKQRWLVLRRESLVMRLRREKEKFTHKRYNYYGLRVVLVSVAQEIMLILFSVKQQGRNCWRPYVTGAPMLSQHLKAHVLALTQIANKKWQFFGLNLTISIWFYVFISALHKLWEMAMGLESYFPNKIKTISIF